MRRFNIFYRQLKESLKDDNFLYSVHHFEKFTVKVLTVILLIIILISLVDLVIILYQDLWKVAPVGFFSKTLIEIFGLFLNILIALELLENLTAYLKQNVFHVELVIVTAIIAIARKIIIFDTTKYTGADLAALGFAIVSLSFCYWLVKQIKVNK